MDLCVAHGLLVGPVTSLNIWIHIYRYIYIDVLMTEVFSLAVRIMHTATMNKILVNWSRRSILPQNKQIEWMRQNLLEIVIFFDWRDLIVSGLVILCFLQKMISREHGFYECDLSNGCEMFVHWANESEGAVQLNSESTLKRLKSGSNPGQQVCEPISGFIAHKLRTTTSL